MKYLKVFEEFSIGGEIGYYNQDQRIQFSQLVGKIIDNVYINEEKTKLCFVTDNKEYHCFYADDDGCNTVWFYNFSGIDAIIHQRINEVNMADWRDVEGDINDDLITQACMWTLKTRRGYIDIELRNTHNGYYGGGVVYELQDVSSIDDMIRIEDDF